MQGVRLRAMAGTFNKKNQSSTSFLKKKINEWNKVYREKWVESQND